MATTRDSSRGDEDRAGGTGRGFADLGLALIVVIAIDVALFRVGLYFPWLQPESYSGRVEGELRRVERVRKAFPGVRHVFVIGNSTALRSVQEVLLDQMLSLRGAADPLISLNLAQGGSSPAAWRVLLESLDVRRDDTAAVVLGISLETVRLGPPQKGRLDLEIVKSRMWWRDAEWMTRQLPSVEARLAATLGVLFRTPAFRADLRQLLAGPRDRWRSVARARAIEASPSSGLRHAQRSERRLPAAKLVGGKLLLTDPPEWLAEDRRERREIQARLGRDQARMKRGQPPLVPSDRQLEGLEETIRAMDRRRVPVVLAILPTAPYPMPCRDVRPFASMVERMSAAGVRVALYDDPPLLAEIEQPRYFADLLHANRAGAEVYTRGLGVFLARWLTD